MAGDASVLHDLTCGSGFVLIGILSHWLPQDRRGRLALREQAKGLPYDSLKLVVAELQPLTEPLGHLNWCVVSR